MKFLAKLFGGNKSEESTSTSGMSAEAVAEATEGANPSALVEFLVKKLADNTAYVESIQEDEGLLINIHCEKEAIGRVIGKNGKTIGAIRRLAFEAAARNDTKIKKIEIIEP
ncbi:MAG: KH domain-containing protein [Lentisphaeria bacterium]|nr:KH domain-containing protein [Lentisphaeria bacterium]NQZ71238.1 KH domain-containing protein [Lentisphaeria bacterium]